jgi:hypothetical protein
VSQFAFPLKIDLVSVAKQLNLSHPTWDLFILLFFLVAVFLYGFSLGRDRIIVILVSIYMALAVVRSLPYLDQFRAEVNVGKVFAFQLTTFLGLFVVLFFVLSRSALLRSLGVGEYGSIVQVMLFSFLQVGLLTSVTLSFLPASALGHFAPLTRLIFVSDIGKFAWVILPVVSLGLIHAPHRGSRL